MSLKALHIIFITVASMFVFGFGGWLIYYHVENSNVPFLLLGIFHLIVGSVLVIYGKRFLQKLKHVKYM